MINRTLARRVEDLEAELLPVVGQTTIIRVDFVERDGTVVGHKDFTVKHRPRLAMARGRAGGGDEDPRETARAV